MAMMLPMVTLMAEAMVSSADINWSNSLPLMVFVAMQLPALPSDDDTDRRDCTADDDCRNCNAIYRCCSNRDCCNGATDCSLASHTTDTWDTLAVLYDGNHMALDIRAVLV